MGPLKFTRSYIIVAGKKNEDLHNGGKTLYQTYNYMV